MSMLTSRFQHSDKHICIHSLVPETSAMDWSISNRTALVMTIWYSTEETIYEIHVRFSLTIVPIRLDVDIVAGGNEGFYRETPVFVDKHHRVIPLMDILDRRAREESNECLMIDLYLEMDFLQYRCQVVTIFPIVMINYYSFERRNCYDKRWI